MTFSQCAWIFLFGFTAWFSAARSLTPPLDIIKFKRGGWQYPLVCPECPISPRGEADGCQPEQVFPVNYVKCIYNTDHRNVSCPALRDVVRMKIFTEPPSLLDPDFPRHPSRTLLIDVSPEFKQQMEQPLTLDEWDKCRQIQNADVKEMVLWMVFILLCFALGVEMLM
jgi:hypothetical protein